MERYTYTAVAPDGRVERGELSAADRAAAIAELQNRGAVPIRADPVGAYVSRLRGGGHHHTNKLLPQRAVGTACRGLATLLQAGFTLDRALEITAQTARPSTISAAVGTMRARVRAGSSLADAIAEQKNFLPPAGPALIRAGETSGALGEVTGQLADNLERDADLRDKVRSGLTYPLIVLITTLLAVGLLLVAVVPAFQPLVDGANTEIPQATWVVLEASEALRQNWSAVLVVFLVLAIGVPRAWKRPAFRDGVDRVGLEIPVMGPIWRAVDAASFTRTLGLLLRHGVGPVHALELASETVSNRRLASALRTCAEPVRQGEGIAATVTATGALPDIPAQMVSLGEQSGHLTDLLARTADQLDAQIKSDIDRALARLVPVVTLLLGALVAGVLGALMSAILSSYRLAL